MSEVDAPTRRSRPVPEDARRCTALGKDGQRCRAYRARDQELCAGHLGWGAAGSRELGRKGAQVKAERYARARHEALTRSVSTPRELMAQAMAKRVEDGRVVAALDRALASSSESTALKAVELVLDRVYPKVTLSEAVPPGTQAYVELRSTLASLPPEDRLAYLREARIAAGIALRETRALKEGEGGASHPVEEKDRGARAGT